MSFLDECVLNREYAGTYSARTLCNIYNLHMYRENHVVALCTPSSRIRS